MNRDRELTYVQLNEQVTLQNQDPVLNEAAARLGVSLSVSFGDIKSSLIDLETEVVFNQPATRGKMTITEQIVRLLRKAGSIKDRIEPLCNKDNVTKVRGKNIYLSCKVCYPIQPERSKREDSQKCEMRCSEHCG
jgi:hypothetical protein